MKTLIPILLLFLAACVHSPQSTKSPALAVKKSAAEKKSRAVRDFADSKQDMKDQIAILNAKARMNGSGPVDIGAPVGSPDFDKSAVDYEELLAAYDRNEYKNFMALYKKFFSKWSRSDYADDALYLKGMMELSRKNYGLALVSFSQILKDYPNGNRAGAAQFAKAATMKKMNLKAQAFGAYKDMTQKYPGSPEAMRAQDELKLLR